MLKITNKTYTRVSNIEESQSNSNYSRNNMNVVVIILACCFSKLAPQNDSCACKYFTNYRVLGTRPQLTAVESSFLVQKHFESKTIQEVLRLFVSSSIIFLVEMCISQFYFCNFAHKNCNYSLLHT